MTSTIILSGRLFIVSSIQNITQYWVAVSHEKINNFLQFITLRLLSYCNLTIIFGFGFW